MSGYKNFRITELWAFCAVDKEDDNQEGIVGMQMANDNWMPLIGSDMKRVEALKETAAKIGKQSNQKIILKKFDNMHIVETIYEPVSK